MLIDATALTPGAVVAVEVDGAEFVVWRGRNGRLGSAPRICPHLDHDLAEGYVVDDELVCPGHGWAFDGHGDAYKRNEFGRVDPKGRVPVLTLRQTEAGIEVGGPGADPPARPTTADARAIEGRAIEGRRSQPHRNSGADPQARPMNPDARVIEGRRSQPHRDR